MLGLKNLTKIICLGVFTFFSGCSVVQEEQETVNVATTKSQQKMEPIIKKEPNEVLKQASIKSGNAESLVVLAEKNYYGVDSSTNKTEALRLFTEAATKGSGYACRRLGLEYSDFCFNDVTPRDDVKARKWFKKGSDLGDSECTFYLSEFVFEGRGGPKNEKEATELLKRAAAQKSRHAAHRALKLEKKGKISLSPEELKNCYILDKELRDEFHAR